jgi:ketosteroid isomerase-like protein
MQSAIREQAGSGAADFGTLQELNLGFIRSVRTSDVGWFDRNLSEDFFNSNPDGTFVDRAAFLGQIARPCPVSNLDVEDVRIRIFGDAAIIHGRTTYRKPDGQAAAGRYTDVWVRRDGRWVCVSGDVTRC